MLLFRITITLFRNNDRGLLNTSDTADLKTSTNLGWQLSLCTAENDIQKFLARGHRSDLGRKVLYQFDGSGA